MTTLEQVLTEIPSFGPDTGKLLLRIMESIHKRIAEGDLSPDVVDQLKLYYVALNRVVDYSIIHQKSAIDQFEHLLRMLAEDPNQ